MTCCKWRSGVPTSKTQCRWIPLGHLFKTCGLQSANHMCNQTTTPTPKTCSFKPENLGFNIFWKFLYCCVFSSSQITSPFFFKKKHRFKIFFSGIKYKYTGGYGMQVPNFFFFYREAVKKWHFDCLQMYKPFWLDVWWFKGYTSHNACSSDLQRKKD